MFSETLFNFMFTETRFEFIFSETLLNFMFTGLMSYGNPPPVCIPLLARRYLLVAISNNLLFVKTFAEYIIIT